MLLTVDYSQVFDRISKDYILCVFEKKTEKREKGFGQTFYNGTHCALMSDTKSCVNYCGWLSDFF